MIVGCSLQLVNKLVFVNLGECYKIAFPKEKRCDGDKFLGLEWQAVPGKAFSSCILYCDSNKIECLRWEGLMVLYQHGPDSTDFVSFSLSSLQFYKVRYLLKSDLVAVKGV